MISYAHSEKLFGAARKSWQESKAFRYFALSYGETVRNLYENHSDKVVPSKEDVFGAFSHFEMSETRYVIVGEEPYFAPSSTGLCYDTTLGHQKFPAARNLSKVLTEVLGPNTSFADLAKKHKVLFLNKRLIATTKYNYFDYVFARFINDLVLDIQTATNNKVRWGFLGKGAIIPLPENSHFILTPHPSPRVSSKFKLRGEQLIKQLFNEDHQNNGPN